MLIGLRPDSEAEEEGLDLIDHGEAGYHFDEPGGFAVGHAPAASAAVVSEMVEARSTSEP